MMRTYAFLQCQCRLHCGSDALVCAKPWKQAIVSSQVLITWHLGYDVSDVTCAQETTCILPPCMCRTKPLYGESDGMRTSAALMAFSPLSLNAMMYVRSRSIGSDFGCGRRSNTSTSKPRLASSIAAHEPAGPAPTTFCLQAFANCSTDCSNVKGRYLSQLRKQPHEARMAAALLSACQLKTSKGYSMTADQDNGKIEHATYDVTTSWYSTYVA